MNKFTVIGTCGHGSSGDVLRAKRWMTGEEVAIKKLTRQRFRQGFDEVLLLREVQALRRLRHVNIIPLKEIIRELDCVLLVFEYLQTSLHQWIKSRILSKAGYPSEAFLSTIGHKILLGLCHMHGHDFVHRDLKPMNVLMTEDAAVLKIADFGSARQISRTGSRGRHVQQQQQEQLTGYVATRWYRAPELLLRSPKYHAAVDVWAFGCTLAETCMMQPLFPGSSEIDQLHRITTVLGTPNAAAWREGLELKQKQQQQQHRQAQAPADGAAPADGGFTKCTPLPLAKVVPPASERLLDLLSSMLQWDPKRRPSAAQAVRHSFFRSSSLAQNPVAQLSTRWRAALSRWVQRATMRTVSLQG